MLPYYDIVLAPLGFADRANAIREAFGRLDFAAMIGAVSDDMVAALAIAGTEDEVRDQARQFIELVDTIILYCPYFGVELDETRANHANMLKIYAG